MTVREIQNQIMDNIILMIMYLPEEQFSANHYDIIGSYKTRQLFLLNCLLLNNGITTDTLFLFYNEFDMGDEGQIPDTIPKPKVNSKWERMRKAIELLEAGRMVDGKRVPYVICDSRGYKKLRPVLYITKEGVEYIYELQEFLFLPGGYNALDIGNYRKVYHALGNKTASAHSLDCTNVMATTALRGRYWPMRPVEKEIGKDESFISVYNIRSDSANVRAIYPDVAFQYTSFDKYETGNTMPLLPVIVEVDLDNERIRSGGTPLGEKLYYHLTYSENISSQLSGPLPCSIICVISENASQAEIAVYQDRNEGYIFTRAQYNFIIYGKFHDTAEKAEELLNGCQRYDYNTPYEEMWKELSEMKTLPKGFSDRLATALEICGIYERYWMEKLTPSGEGRLKKLAKYSASLSYDVHLDGRLFRKSREKAKKVADYLEKKDYRLESRYLRGDSLAIVPMSRYSDYLISLHPYMYGMQEVKAVFRFLHLPEKAEYFYPLFPLLRSSEYNYSVVLRNCFLTGGVRVFFEDISADLSALTRIKDYITMPSQMCRNTMLVIIIDDDDVIAGGKKLDRITYTRGLSGEDNDHGASFDDCFLRTMPGTNNEATLSYRRNHDFMFLRRSEFLSRNPDKMNPFVVIKHRYYSRYFRSIMFGPLHYLNDIGSYHECSCEVQEFRAFDVKGEVYRKEFTESKEKS